VRRAYLLCFAREPTAAELATALEFLRDDAADLATHGALDATTRARVDLCQALLSSNEFVHVE
jgi:hypothetical protein